MRKMKKGSIAMLVALLTAQLAIPAGPARASEVPVEQVKTVTAVQSGAHWAQSSIDKWTGYGVVQGYPDGLFHPNEKVTRAEIATIINRLFGYSVKSDTNFLDVPAQAWYNEALSIAKAAGYYEGFPGNLAKATSYVTRQDAVTLISKAFSLNNVSAVSEMSYKDAGDISPYAREAIAALSGAVSGFPDGTFRPAENMTRAELVTVIDHLVAKYVQHPGAVSVAELQGHIIINESGIALKDSNVSGNIYLAPGIHDGDAELQQVTVHGNAYIWGGGSQSIHIDHSKIDQVNVNRAEGIVRAVLSGITSVDQMIVSSPAMIEVGEQSVIAALEISNNGAGTEIEGQGNIGEIITLVDNVKINGQLLEKSKKYSLSHGDLVDPSSSGITTPPATGNGVNAGTGSGGTGGGGSPGIGADAVYIVDSKATAETKSLFAFLNETRGKNVLFGHQHATTQSIAGKDDQGAVIADVPNSVGDYPAVFGWDTLSLDGHETPPGVSGDYEASRIGLSKEMKRAYEMGGIVTLSMHPYNFVTGGNFNDTSNTPSATQSVVSRILPGGDKNPEFREWLDRIASFATQLKDDDGKLIPVLFRPFHEQNGSWFWWGAATTTKSEYVELYRYTVEYLRDVKNVRNFLYVYSPNGPFNGNENEYLTTYPGDEFVDILGMDQYDSKDNAGSDSFLNGLVKDLKMVSKLADKRGKVATFSEYGYSAQGMYPSGNSELQWFTKVLDAIKSDPDAKRIAYMLTWANFGEDSNNLFVPYKDVAGKGSHELLDDFIDYYNDPYTSFMGELKGQNVYGRKVNTAAGKPFMHIVTPTNIGTVSEAPYVIRAKVLNAIPSKVTYKIGDAGAEVEMKLDADGYYSAPWSPDTALNGNAADIKVRAYLSGARPLEQSVSAFIKVRELAIKELTFDQAEDLELVNNNGTWPESIKMELAHAIWNGDGKLAMTVREGLEGTETWQELKLQLTDKALENVELAKVNLVKLSALIPETLDGTDSAIRAIVMLPDDWDTKYGMNETYTKLSELEKIELLGKTYYKYEPVIELDAAAAATASGLAVSLVGSGLEQSGSESIYVDDIGLFNAYTAPIMDMALVDDFEAYGGANDAVSAKYPKAGGDDVSVSLSPDHKKSGEYGLKLHFSIDNSGYTGVGKSLGTVDWSDNNALSLWVKNDNRVAFAELGEPLKLVIQIHMNGTAYEAYPELEPGKAYDLSIPFSEFEVAPWSSGGPITKESLKKVTNFNMYINSMDQGKHSGVLYLDDIRAVNDSSAPELPDQGEEQPGTPAGVLYKFESEADLVGWKLENSETQAEDPAFDPAEGTLSVKFPLTTGEFELVTTPSNLDLRRLDSITAQVKLTSGTAKARLFMKTGSSWAWSDSEIVQIDANGYTTLTISLPEAAQGKDVDLKDIKVIGIKIEEISNDGGTAKLHLKEMALNGVEPALHYGFDKDTEGWTSDIMTVTQGVYTENNINWNVLQNEVTWPAGQDFIAVSKHGQIDLSVFDGITAKVKIVSDVPGVQAKLFIQLKNYDVWIDSGAVAADGSGFTTLKIDFSTMTPHVNSGKPFTMDDLKEGDAIGVQFVAPGGTSGSAMVYIDEVTAYKN